MGASSRSPSPMTMVPSMRTDSMAVRIASTASLSLCLRRPWPMEVAQAMAACSTTRRNSRDRVCSMVGLLVDRESIDSSQTVHALADPVEEWFGAFFNRKHEDFRNFVGVQIRDDFRDQGEELPGGLDDQHDLLVQVGLSLEVVVALDAGEDVHAAGVGL